MEGLSDEARVRAVGDVPAISLTDEAVMSAMTEMVESIVAAEFYCQGYVSKDQPQAQGLLHTLHDSMVRAQHFA